jgi:hypothetical protein
MTYFRRGMAIYGVPMMTLDEQPRALARVGFVNIHHETRLIPLNDEAGGPKQRLLTSYMRNIMPELVSAMANKALPAAGLSVQETRALMQAALESLMDRSVIIGFNMLIARAQKPLTAV